MKTRILVVNFVHGLHARVAAQVVKLTRRHNAAVHVRSQGRPRANARSILQLLTLGAVAGTHLEVTADGPDENAVVQELAELFEQGGGI